MKKYEYSGTGYRLVVDAGKGSLSFIDGKTGECLLRTPDLDMFVPVVDDSQAASPARVSMEKYKGSPAGVDLTARPGRGPVSEIRLAIRCHRDHVTFQTHWRPSRACRLYRYRWFPAGTTLNLYDMLNFRWGQYTDRCVEVLRLGVNEIQQTSTDGKDWNFWPHPDLIVFNKHRAYLATFVKDLPPSFGTYVGVQKHSVRHWYMNVGEGLIECGADEEMSSPEFAVQLTHADDIYGAVDRYTAILARERRILRRDPHTEPRWWRQPLYCTWLDQGFVFKQGVPGAWGKPASEQDSICDALVNRALRIIKKEKLRFASWIIDDGWQRQCGDWRPNPARFKNLRRTVDKLHAAGFKVVIWWPGMEFDPDCPAAAEHPEWFAARGRVLNCHGRPAVDYSNPVTRELYLRPLLRFFFSPEPDCLDLDGVKYDFMADKVNPDVPVSDPAWIGEQRYFYNMMHFVQETARGYKPDACMHAYCPHPYFNSCVDVNRTADVNDSNYLAHRTRGRMLDRLCPGVTVSYDFHGFREKFPDYLEMALKDGVPFQIGSVMGHANSGERFTGAEYGLLRKAIRKFTPITLVQ